MRGDECQRQDKIVSSAMNKPMHNARKMSRIKTLRECLLNVKGVKLQRKNDTRLSDDDSRDEGLDNKIKTWKTTSSS